MPGKIPPYIEMHEFEALLFSDADVLAEKTEINVSQIRGILAEYNNPEEINDDPARAPSKRLEALRPGYRKVAVSKTVTTAVGIQVIREKCPHFNNWLTKFENLKGKTLKILKKKRATEAMQKLRGSGNGNLVTTLLEEREKDKLR